MNDPDKRAQWIGFHVTRRVFSRGMILAGELAFTLNVSASRQLWYTLNMQPATQQHIETTPGKCGGKPCVKGTRIRVWDIYVLHELQGKSADEVVAAYPELSIGDVYAALAYYWDNKAEIDAAMNAADEFVAHMKAAAGPGPLARKLASSTQGDGAVSS